MTDHPIEGLMKTAMEAIKGMIDVNTVIGDAVETQDGGVIIPVSRVSLGFAAGGAEYASGGISGGDEKDLPFGGGSGAGVSVQPVGFLVLHEGEVRLLPVDANSVVERLIDQTPQLLDQISELVGRHKDGRQAVGVASHKKEYDYRDKDENDRGYLR